MDRTFVGIDTDAKGSVAILSFPQRKSPWLDIYALPNRDKVLSSGKKRLEIDYPVLAATMIELMSRVSVERIFLEDQWSRPMQDSGATFTFGKTFGDCRTACAAGLISAGLSPSEAEEKLAYSPGADWKLAMGLSSDKDLSLKLASQLFPNCSQAWALKSKHTSAAEAALLALWGASKSGVAIAKGTTILAARKPLLLTLPSLVSI